EELLGQVLRMLVVQGPRGAEEGVGGLPVEAAEFADGLAVAGGTAVPRVAEHRPLGRRKTRRGAPHPGVVTARHAPSKPRGPKSLPISGTKIRVLRMDPDP